MRTRDLNSSKGLTGKWENVSPPCVKLFNKKQRRISRTTEAIDPHSTSAHMRKKCFVCSLYSSNVLTCFICFSPHSACADAPLILHDKLRSPVIWEKEGISVEEFQVHSFEVASILRFCCVCIRFKYGIWHLTASILDVKSNFVNSLFDRRVEDACWLKTGLGIGNYIWFLSWI